MPSQASFPAKRKDEAFAKLLADRYERERVIFQPFAYGTGNFAEGVAQAVPLIEKLEKEAKEAHAKRQREFLTALKAEVLPSDWLRAEKRTLASLPPEIRGQIEAGLTETFEACGFATRQAGKEFAGKCEVAGVESMVLLELCSMARVGGKPAPSFSTYPVSRILP